MSLLTLTNDIYTSWVIAPVHRLSWSIPSDVQECLLYVQVVRHSWTYTRRTASAPIYTDPGTPNELEMEMAGGDGKDTAILATFNLKGGRVREIMSPTTFVSAVNCASEDAAGVEMKNVKINQVGQSYIGMLLFF